MRRAAVLSAVAAAALALPAAAWAHAALLHTVPEASGTVNVAPPEVQLTYSEPIEPRFAIVSVTDAAGRQVTSGQPASAPGSPQTLVTPLEHVPEGWYLVFWRVISADGHPVRGAFTFAVGPNPGPPPQFRVPSLSETATTTRLLVSRWLVFLAVLSSLGLFVLRALIARPVARTVRGTSLRALNVAFAVAVAVSLVVIPVYVVVATAQFTLRSVFDLGAIVPVARDSGFGKDFLDLEVVFALFAVAAGAALFLDRPEREQRSVVELLALPAALAAGAAALLLPALAGHAGQKSPRGLALPLDVFHLGAVAVWLGGLIGLVVLWLSVGRAARSAVLAYVVPRFSAVAFCSVLLLIGTGTGQALLELPTLASLWQTSYGQALLVEDRPARGGARARGREPGPHEASAPGRRRLGARSCSAASCRARSSSSWPRCSPPRCSRASRRPSSALAKVQNVAARVGPGPVTATVSKSPYKVRVQVTPNRAAVPNAFSLTLTRNGKPVPGAEVITKFDMLDMEMGEQSYRLREQRPGVFSKSAPALVMVGHWGLQFEVTPPGGKPFVVTLLDKASG